MPIDASGKHIDLPHELRQRHCVPVRQLPQPPGQPLSDPIELGLDFAVL